MFFFSNFPETCLDINERCRCNITPLQVTILYTNPCILDHTHTINMYVNIFSSHLVCRTFWFPCDNKLGTNKLGSVVYRNLYTTLLWWNAMPLFNRCVYLGYSRMHQNLPASSYSRWEQQTKPIDSIVQRLTKKFIMFNTRYSLNITILLSACQAKMLQSAVLQYMVLEGGLKLAFIWLIWLNSKPLPMFTQWHLTGCRILFSCNEWAL